MTAHVPAPFRGGVRTVFVLVAAAAAGCGRGGSSAEVTGTVVLAGQPVPGADVQFVPKADPALGVHEARTDGSGNFVIRTDGSNTPLRPGEYVVLVRKLAAGGGMGAMKNEVPASYGERSRSPLRAEVKPGSQTLPPFELKELKELKKPGRG